MLQSLCQTWKQTSGNHRKTWLGFNLTRFCPQDALSSETSVFLSDVETDVWPKGSTEAIANSAARLLVTRGESGADEFLSSEPTPLHHPPFKVEKAVDTNGAGDTFATAFMLSLASGGDNPGVVANWAGAKAVLQPQVRTFLL